MRRLILVFVALVVVWILTPFWVMPFAQWITHQVTPQKVERSDSSTVSQPVDLAPAGQLGDMFGTINSLFSGLALIGVAYGLYLQTQHKRREKQPEVFARLASTAEERPIVLARNDDTPLGRVQFSLQVPVYIEAGSGAIALNVAIRATYGDATKHTTLPTPVFTGIKLKDPHILNLTIEATALSPMILQWKEQDAYPLGQVDLYVEFENQQRAKWRVTARYAVAVRSEDDADSLKVWINKAAASSIPTQQIELDTVATTWHTDDL